MENVLRTPDERFASLPGWPFEPQYTEVDGLRIHYVDEGPRSAAPVLLLHGEPSWGYLYRKMIPVLVAAGHRVVVPDLVGFGRSDKPTRAEDYTYARHLHWMRGVIRRLELTDITLVGQDWGGMIGLRLVAEQTALFARAVAANTFLATGEFAPPEAFLQWREFAKSVPNFEAGSIVKNGCAREVPPEVVAAYDAPFPDESYKMGARRFPQLVPVEFDDPESVANRQAWQSLAQFRKPFLTAFGDSDKIFRGGDEFMRAHIPGTANQPHVLLEKAGHFLQEDVGEELARHVNQFIAANMKESA